jgi:hypothetical protein
MTRIATVTIHNQDTIEERQVALDIPSPLSGQGTYEYALALLAPNYEPVGSDDLTKDHLLGFTLD